jgi:hypothetical protein
MKNTTRNSIICAALLIGCLSPVAPARDSQQARHTDPPRRDSASPLLGRWKVQFTNGVKEVCNLSTDGTASVVEPLRTAAGNAEVRGRSVVIFYQDDRVERWTSVGERFVVEHWFPASRFETATPVLGIADLVR